jgi:hypothetical protein
MKGTATPNGALRRVEYWYEAHGIGKRDSEDQALCGRAMKASTKPFALCIDGSDYHASLIPGKVYRILSDPRAARDGLIRIVDESGEDYLASTPLPQGVEGANFCNLALACASAARPA